MGSTPEDHEVERPAAARRVDGTLPVRGLRIEVVDRNARRVEKVLVSAWDPAARPPFFGAPFRQPPGSRGAKVTPR